MPWMRGSAASRPSGSRRAWRASALAIALMLAPASLPARAAAEAPHADPAPSPSDEITPEQWDADIAMRLGEHAYLGGDVLAALAAFQSAASKDPRRAEAHWRCAHCLAILNRIPDALRELDRAREIAPHDPRILNTLAVIQLKTGNTRSATESARHAVSQAPRVADVWDTLGWAYLQSGDAYRAHLAFETALRLDPNHPSAKDGLAKSR